MNLASEQALHFEWKEEGAARERELRAVTLARDFPRYPHVESVLTDYDVFTIMVHVWKIDLFCLGEYSLQVSSSFRVKNKGSRERTRDQLNCEGRLSRATSCDIHHVESVLTDYDVIHQA